MYSYGYTHSLSTSTGLSSTIGLPAYYQHANMIHVDRITDRYSA